MSKILINNTASNIIIVDVGKTLLANSSFTIPPQEYKDWAGSSNIITEIGSGNVTVNDGSTNLSISDGIDLIKGIFPKKIGIRSGDDLTDIGHVGDRLKVDAQSGGGSGVFIDPTLAISSGQITDVEHVNKFGQVQGLSGSQFETVWDGSAPYYWISTAGVITIESSSSNDVDLTGSGSWKVEIQGLDANYNPVIETISLNGTTQVTSTNSFKRVFRANVIEANTIDTYNDGDISIKHMGNLVAKIRKGNNSTLMALYTIKAGYTGFLTRYYYGNPKDEETEVHLETRGVGKPFRLHHNLIGEGSSNIILNPYIVLEEKTDIHIRAKSKISEHEFSASFDIILVKNTLLV